MEMEITFLGTGVGIPHSGRSQAGLIMKSEKPLLFDCGAGSLLRLAEAGFCPLDIDSVLLTHLHLDHVSDLLALAKARWLMGVDEIEIYGPEGTKEWFIANQGLYSYLQELEVTFHILKPNDKFSLTNLEIEVAEAVHSLPAVGYRVKSETKVVVYSGDTEPTLPMAELARGSDLLVHECSFPEPYEVTNHTTPKKLGAVLQEVKRVVLTHLYPQTIGHEDEMIRDVREGIDTGVDVEIGQDLQQIRL